MGELGGKQSMIRLTAHLALANILILVPTGYPCPDSFVLLPNYAYLESTHFRWTAFETRCRLSS